MREITTSVQIIFQQHCNGYRRPRLFGGQMMAWIDVIAAIAARRYAHAVVTTVCVDNLTFIRPAYLHDTLYIDYYHTDTIVLPDTHYLPVYITDTIWPDSVVHDTLRFTRYDTIYVDRIVIDTIIFTRYDTIISVETVYDTLRFTDTVTRFVVDTLILHDTIYLTDSASLGLDQTSESRFALRAVGNILVVDNPDCQPLWVYDTAWRLVVASRGRSHVELQLPAAGVYIVRVGDNIKRITTIR